MKKLLISSILIASLALTACSSTKDEEEMPTSSVGIEMGITIGNGDNGSDNSAVGISTGVTIGNGDNNDDVASPSLTLDVSAGEFFFEPANLNFNSGEEVTINLVNNGKGMHDFRIEELDLGTSIIGSGETESFTFTVPADQDSLTFFCSVSGHRQLGMEGTITIN